MSMLLIARSRREVVQRMMSRAQRAVADAGADADDFHRIVAVRDVIFNLLERSRREKARGGDGENFFPARRQSRRDADEILLGYPDFDDLLGQRRAKGSELAGAAGIASDCENISIRFCHREKRVGEFFQVRATHFQAELLRDLACRRGIHGGSGRAHRLAPSRRALASSNSRTAIANSDSLGTP